MPRLICKLMLPLLVVMAMGFTNRAPRPSAEVALVIDLSGSTNGLLDDIRDNIWNFVNSFRLANPEQDLRLAVVGFSRGSFGAENAYIRVLSDLTTNYDLISYRLFELVATVEKGDQYVGAAIKMAIDNLTWSKGPNRRLIMLFGNSRADLGSYDYNRAVEWALDKKIVINSVYCSQGGDNPKYLGQWHSIADRTGGNLFKMQVTRRSPNKFRSQATERLVEFNNSVNDTYVPYNRSGSVDYQLMLAADINALQMGELFFHSRCLYKLSDSYQTHLASFDLVSYVNDHGRLPAYHRHYLPEHLTHSTDNELLEIAKIKATRRNTVLSKLKNSIMFQQPDSFAVNPIDSIFMESVMRHN